MSTGDPFQHFVQAQQERFPRACAELAAGEKQGHWMWFIFPQLAGLGSSSMAKQYSIASLEKAADYLQHPVLGPRLHDVTQIVNDVESRSISQIFAYPDDLKFHSSMTLFALATEHLQLPHTGYHGALTRYFSTRMDEATLRLLVH